MFDGIMISLPAIIKARASNNGRRLVEVESSSEDVDSEGDVILQRALMGSMVSFLANGHIDLDHLSEIGHRLGIPNPSAYIIGRPTEVIDLGKGRTSVVCEITKSLDGSFDPVKNKYDEFWDSLRRDPPVAWRASIYGFPIDGMVEDCRETGSCSHGAKRFLVKGIDWRSLAMTRNPVNDSLQNVATIVTEKAFIKAYSEHRAAAIKDMGFGNGITYSQSTAIPEGAPPESAASVPPPPMNWPRNPHELYGQYHLHIKENCPFTGGVDSAVLFKDHFMGCCGMDADSAGLFADALMYRVLADCRGRGRARA